MVGIPPMLEGRNPVNRLLIWLHRPVIALVLRLKTPTILFALTILTAGQFEYMQRGRARLAVVVPVTLLLIFVLLYMNFGRLTETLIECW